MQSKSSKLIQKIVFSGVFLALCMVLPMLTLQDRQLGQMFSLMHIPVLLCGFVCGWPYGLAVGFIAPLMRSLIFGMPPMFPIALSMAFELAAYGLATGLLYKLSKKDTLSVYITLVASMLIGRLVWGGAMSVLTLASANAGFTFAAFIAGAFTKAVPGIICHILLVPALVISLKGAKLMPND